MRYTVSVPGRKAGAQFQTPHGPVAIDPVHGTATLSDAQRAHLEQSYGATCVPYVDGDVVLTEVAVLREPTPGEIAAAATIHANGELAQQAAAQAQHVPVPAHKSKRRR